MDPITLLAIRRFAPYVIGGLIISIFLGYLHHKIDMGGFNRAAKAYEKRDAKDAEKSAVLLEQAEKRVSAAHDNHQEILTGVLTHDSAVIQDLSNKLNVALSSRVLVATTKAIPGSGNPLRGKTDIPKSNAGGGEGSCNQELADDNKRSLIQAEFKIARLAELHKSCIEEIERTHILK